MRSILMLNLSLLLFAACAQRESISPAPSISPETRAALRADVDCRNARRQIKILESERASTSQRALAGARSVMPISAAAGILTGDYRDRVAVATGQYNADLTAKIEQIRAVCGVR